MSLLIKSIQCFCNQLLFVVAITEAAIQMPCSGTAAVEHVKNILLLQGLVMTEHHIRTAEKNNCKKFLVNNLQIHKIRIEVIHGTVDRDPSGLRRIRRLAQPVGELIQLVAVSS